MSEALMLGWVVSRPSECVYVCDHVRLYCAHMPGYVCVSACVFVAHMHVCV